MPAARGTTPADLSTDRGGDGGIRAGSVARQDGNTGVSESPQADPRLSMVGGTTVLLTAIVVSVIVAVIVALYGVALRGAPEDK
jgi:hypothetical protein